MTDALIAFGPLFVFMLIPVLIPLGAALAGAVVDLGRSRGRTRRRRVLGTGAEH